jgi:tetratricopeptide (TPR) repeat protein
MLRDAPRTRIRIKPLALALALCLAATSVSANQAVLAGSFASQGSSPELQTGVALLQRKAYPLAALVLRRALELSPDDPMTQFYLGVALNRTTAGKEAESLLKRGLGESPDSPEVNFELGLHYFNKEVLAEASDYFEQVIYLAPTDYHAEEARAYLKKIEERSLGKPWEMSALSGIQYDSNVMLSNGSQPLPKGYSHKGDWSGVVNVRGSYTPVRNNALEVVAGYSLYQNLHASLSDFDITQNLVSLSASYTLTPKVKVMGNYSFEYLVLGKQSYDYSNTLSPSLSVSHGKWGTTTLDYHYSSKSYWNSANFSTNTERNGDNHLLGLSQLLPLDSSTTLWMIYSHEIDLTQNRALGSQGDRVLIGCRRLLPFALLGDLSGDVSRRQYLERDPAYGVRRQDTQFSVSLSVTKALSERYSLSLGEVLSRNLSNISDFVYTRALTSALVSARF